MLAPFTVGVLMMVALVSTTTIPAVFFLLIFLSLPFRFPLWIWRKAFPAWLAGIRLPWTPTMDALELYAKGRIAEAAKDAGAAFDLYLKAAHLGHPWAAVKVESETLKQNHASRHRAVKNLRRQRFKALVDHLWQRKPLSARAAERLYRAGLSKFDSKDFDNAQGLFLEAARLGHPNAIAQVSYNYTMGCWGDGQEPDYAQGLPWIRSGAEQDLSADLLVTMGKCYEYGLGALAPNGEEALYWFWRAAERGHPRADKFLERYA